jgi:hypothetical protein
MIHSMMVGAVYVAMVLAPCAIAWFTPVEDPDNAPDANVLEDGFI